MIGLITCANLTRFFPSKTNAFLTHDDQILVDYLAHKGIAIKPILWGTPPAELVAQGPPILLMRSPWDYVDSSEHCHRFQNWLSDLAFMPNLTVINDPTLMLWSLDKRYLNHLQQCGIPIIPTTFIEPDQAVNFQTMVEQQGAIVVKPACGAGAKDIYRLSSPGDAASFDFSRIRDNRTFLRQPFVKEIMTDGEWSLIFIEECFSHAVWKLPSPGSWLVQDEFGGSVISKDPPPCAIKLAQQTMAALSSAFTTSTGQTFIKPLYARVDIMIAHHNHAMVSEVELVEPELFFLNRHAHACLPNHHALERFYQALVKLL